jgi:very-short-patch-repair endonuclease
MLLHQEKAMPAPPINRRLYKSAFAQDFTSPLRGGRSAEFAQRTTANGWGSGEPPPSTVPTERARHLRKNATPAERLLWSALRHLKSRGFHFRRQAPFDRYVVDFACHGAKLIVEIDGSQHGDPDHVAHDAKRTRYLNSRGYQVLRFWNEDVMSDCSAVVEAILRAAPTR